MKMMLTLVAAGLLTTAATQAQVSQAERQALIDFYHATGGAQWHDDSGWLDGAGSECYWHGVECAGQHTDNAFVLRLILNKNNLAGQLPESLAGLERLESLYLHDNDLGGTIPSDLWGLANLTHLSLRGNNFHGSVPAAILAMPEGRPSPYVDLADNLLDGFEPADLSDVSTGLQIELDLANNRITALPPLPWRASAAIEVLDLSGNRIAGSLVLDDGPWPGLQELALTDNAITELASLAGADLPDLQTLDLAWNRLSSLPDSLPELDKLSRLELGNNRLSGELPEWFADMKLGRVGLDNNDLSGPIARVFAALDMDNFPKHTIRGMLGLHLHVANNRFTGSLPDVEFERFNLAERGPSSEFGLDLCFNPIEPPDSARLELIDPFHRGWALSPCLNRETVEVDPTFSGSWYHPERSGEGFIQLLLDNGQVLNYWFTHAPPQHGQPPKQMWLMGMSEPGASWSEFKPLWITRGGRFGEGIAGGKAQPSSAWVRHNRTGPDTMHSSYHYNNGGICITGACSSDILADRLDLARLSSLAGTTCDNQRRQTQEFSGAWYNPERAGEGFIVEILPDERAVVYWFTHKPHDSGEQAWMVGVGEARWVMPLPPGETNVSLTFDEVYQPVGGQFGPAFDPADVEMVDWGELSIHFQAENFGDVHWDSHLEEYGSGSYSIHRLARPMLAECEEGEDA